MRTRFKKRKVWRKVGIKCMPRKCGVGKNLPDSHINGSMKNECFAVQGGAFHTDEEQAELELLDELLSS